jgi:predicted DNA binding CopG/RHH family protein
MHKLDEEELEILEAVESGNIKRAENATDIQVKHQKYAEAMFKKNIRINIRLSSRDLRGLQKKALTKGIPYRTLVSSVLHKYVEGRLSEKSS